MRASGLSTFLLCLVLAGSHSVQARKKEARKNAPAGSPVVGAYVWGGLLGDVPSVDAFHKSIAFLLDKNFSAVRFTITSAALDGYGVPREVCEAERDADGRSPCYLKEFLNDAVFRDPRLHLVMITLHDFTSEHHITEPDYLQAHRSAILHEYADDLAVLNNIFGGRAVRVILSNWEGDNMVYCGSIFEFTNNAEFEAKCAAKVNGNFAVALQGFAAWIALRDEAIAQFRAEHASLDVRQAPEFSNLNLFGESCHTTCRPDLTVFETLRAGKRQPLCSYSAYDSVNRKRLDQDLDRIATVCDQVVLGELGIGLKGTDLEGLKDRYKVVADALKRHGGEVPAVMLWHAFEAPSADRPLLQLYEQDGSPADIRALPPMLSPHR